MPEAMYTESGDGMRPWVKRRSATHTYICQRNAKSCYADIPCRGSLLLDERRILSSSEINQSAGNSLGCNYLKPEAVTIQTNSFFCFVFCLLPLNHISTS